MAWRVAKCLDVLLDQVNQLAPHRSKVSDGSIGDPAHSARVSDHNPDGQGIVHARDFTHDPAGGLDGNLLSHALEVGRDPRIKYVIWNRHIMSGTGQNRPAWVWRPYTGANAHQHHVHVSVKPAPAADSMDLWSLDFKSKTTPPVSLVGLVSPQNKPLWAKSILESLGWKSLWAAGMIANLMQEAGPLLDNTSIEGDNGHAHALGQWQSLRFIALQKFADERGKFWTDFETQIRFIDHEMHTTEKKAWAKMREAETLDASVDAGIAYFRPSKPRRDIRIKYAQTLT